jgi:multiple sugar transport system substrate-binding protein
MVEEGSMTNRRFPSWIAWIAGVSLLLAACGGGDDEQQSTQATGPDRHKGVEVTVLTFTGPQIAEPLQRRAPDFNRLTGAKINVVTVPFADLYDKILADLATGTNSYDAFVFDPSGWATSCPRATWRTSVTGSRATRR